MPHRNLVPHQNLVPHRNLVPHQILELERLLFQKFDLAEVFVLEVLRLRAEVLIVLQAFGDVSVT